MDELCTHDSPVDQQLDAETRRSLRASLPTPLRALYRSILCQTLASGAPVNPNALVVVLSAHCESGEEALHFTSDHVSELLWFGIHEFCEDHELEVPAECPEALHSAISAASEMQALSQDSDPPSELFRALEDLLAS